MKTRTEPALREEIFEKVREYCRLFHKKPAFTPGKSRIDYGGRVYDEKEMVNLVGSALDFWLTAGPCAGRFERELARFLGVARCSLVNSGSSANLLAFAALASPELGARRVRAGDEVITVAAGFPTTVTPIMQCGAVPVFADVEIPSCNIDCSLLEKARSAKTRAVMLAHTLGNPFDVSRVKKFCDRHGFWLIEDNCDSLGSRYAGKFTGTFGDIGTSSFYPPHHMTTGEGGAVYTDNPRLKKIVDSLRDWGRDCWCAPGRDNTCGRRFARRFGALPAGYDHKYVYSHFGYNLKATEMQAAVGLAQLEKLPGFIEARKRNWRFFRSALEEFSDMLILPEPAAGSDPSWFGFLLTVGENAGFTRDELVGHLESRKIQTRMLFAGNLLKHPCFDELRRSGKGFRAVSARGRAGGLPVTDRIMRDAFWLGVYPGLSEEAAAYIVSAIREFMTGRRR